MGSDAISTEQLNVLASPKGEVIATLGTDFSPHEVMSHFACIMSGIAYNEPGNSVRVYSIQFANPLPGFEKVTGAVTRPLSLGGGIKYKESQDLP